MRALSMEKEEGTRARRRSILVVRGALPSEPATSPSNGGGGRGQKILLLFLFTSVMQFSATSQSWGNEENPLSLETMRSKRLHRIGWSVEPRLVTDAERLFLNAHASLSCIPHFEVQIPIQRE